MAMAVDLRLRSFVLIMGLLVISGSMLAQEVVQTVDVIVTNSIGVLRGEILSFDEETGGVTFKDTRGKTYFFKAEEYRYFEKDQVYTPKAEKEKKPILPRKAEGFRFNAGFSGSMLMVREDLVEDGYIVNGLGDSGYDFLLASLRLGLNKHLDEQNIIGLTTTISFAGEIDSYFDIGLRYAYVYDNKRSNLALYIPIGISYSSFSYDWTYQLNDTLFSPQDPLSFETPLDREVNTQLSTVDLSIGQGFSFINADEKSIGLELILFRSFIMNQQFLSEGGLRGDEPELSMNGIRLTFFYNF